MKENFTLAKPKLQKMYDGDKTTKGTKLQA